MLRPRETINRNLYARSASVRSSMAIRQPQLPSRTSYTSNSKSLSGTNRRLLIKCLDENNENLLKPDWQNCIGSAKVEVLTVEDLYHWACSRLSSATELQEFRNTSQCLLEGMEISEIAAGIRECKGSSRTF